MIKSSEKTKSTGNLTFALDTYPKHDVRYDTTFLISLFNWKKRQKLFEIFVLFRLLVGFLVVFFVLG